MRIFAVVFVLALSLHSCRAQAVKTVVSGTILDPNGVPYAGGTIDATLLPTGTTPTVAGVGQIDGYVQPVAIATNGSFTLPLYCNTAGGGCTAISPASTQWMFTVRNPGAPPPVGFGGISFTVTVTITGATQSITSQLQAAAPRLLVSSAAGSGPVSGSGTTGFIPLWSSSTALGNSPCDDGITFALTVTCTHSLATTGNITLSGGTIFTGTLESSTPQGNDLDVFCDTVVSCHLNLGSNAANELVALSGGSIAMNAISGATLSNGAGGLIGGAQGAGTFNAMGLFINGNPVTALAAAVNITPVTVNGPGTGLQNLQSSAIGGTGAENTLGKTFRFHTGGTMLTASGKIEFTFGIGTGTGSPAISGFTPGSPGSTYDWALDGTCSTTTTGATGAMLCAGSVSFGGAPSNTSLDSSISPFNFTISNANLTGALTLQVQVLFSAASGSNTATENILTVEQMN